MTKLSWNGCKTVGTEVAFRMLEMLEREPDEVEGWENVAVYHMIAVQLEAKLGLFKRQWLNAAFTATLITFGPYTDDQIKHGLRDKLLDAYTDVKSGRKTLSDLLPEENET